MLQSSSAHRAPLAGGDPDPAARLGAAVLRPAACCRSIPRRCRCRRTRRSRRSRPSAARWASTCRCRSNTLIWLAGALHGDFGRSIQFAPRRRPLVADDPAGHDRACRLRHADRRGARPRRRACCCSTCAARALETGRRPRLDRAAVDPGIPLGAAVHAVPVRRRCCRRCRSPAGWSPGCRGRTSPAFCCSTRCWPGARTCSASALQHMILPAVALGLAFSPADHAGAALEPDRRLSGGLHPARRGCAASPNGAS